MRYNVTLRNAAGRETVVPVDARTMQGACARASRKLNRAEPRDDRGKLHNWLPVASGVQPMGWSR